MPADPPSSERVTVRRRPRTGRALVTATAVAALTLLLADPASADPASAVGIGAVHTAAARDSLSVPVWTDTPGAHVTTVDATLTSGGRVVDLPLVDPDGDGLYGPASPVTAGGTLPTLGRWAVSVTATDSAAGTTTRADAGVFDFTDRPVVDPAALHATSGSHAHPDSTVSGTAYFLAPGSSTPAPLANRSVSVSHGASAAVGAATQTVTTDGAGHFTTTAFPNGGGASYTVTVTGADDQLDGSASAEVDSPTDYSNSTVVLTAAANHARVPDNSHYVVSGQVTLGKAPVAGVAVRVTSSALPGPGALVTTGPTGRYSATLLAVAQAYGGGNYWQASVVDPYLSSETASGTVAVPAAATYSGVRITLAASGRVTATGTIGFTYVAGTGVTYQEVTYLEYSPNGTTAWRAIGHVTSGGGVGETFSVSGAGYVDGFYRLRHAQSDALDATTTAPVHRSRVDTYVFGNDATPEPIKKGRTLSVSGTLQQYVRGWHPMAHTRIYLYFLPRGGHTYNYVAAGTTDARGRVTLRGKAVSDGYWQLHYFGDATHFDSGDTDDYVDVR